MLPKGSNENISHRWNYQIYFGAVKYQHPNWAYVYIYILHIYIYIYIYVYIYMYTCTLLSYIKGSL